MQPHPSRPADLVMPALPFVDIVHCNRSEAMTVTGAPTVEAAVTNLLERGPQMVLLTAGARGAQVRTTAHTVTQPGFDVDVADATGCGDAFCAGVIGWLTDHAPTPTRATLEEMTTDRLGELLAYAQAVGASAATKTGCVEGVSHQVVEGLRAAQGWRVLAATSTERELPGA
jgi:sugar/nucleoside kinase (ribokinase family)